MDKRTGEEQSTVVSGDGGTRLSSGFRFTTAKLAVAGVVVVLGMIGILASQLFVSRERDAPASKDTAVQKSQDLKDNGNYAQSAAYAADSYAKTDADTQKYLLAIEAATGYESNKDYQKALEWYKTAAGLKQKDPASAAGMARSYDALGRKAEAVEYYQKTIDWYDRTDVAISNDIPMYEKLRDKAKASL